jgi:hypothetical protein
MVDCQVEEEIRDVEVRTTYRLSWGAPRHTPEDDIEADWAEDEK